MDTNQEQDSLIGAAGDQSTTLRNILQITIPSDHENQQQSQFTYKLSMSHENQKRADLSTGSINLDESGYKPQERSISQNVNKIKTGAEFFKKTDGWFEECISPTTLKNATGDINIKTSQIVLSPRASSQRSFYDRTFSKLDRGSVRGSIFNLVSSALGGGMLALAYVFVLSGWLIGFLLLVLGACSAAISNLLLAKMAVRHDIKNLDEVAFKVGGQCFRTYL